MVESLVQFIMGLPPEKLAEVYPEDMALCAAWYDSYREAEAKRAPYAGLAERIEQWVETAVPAAPDTEGPRQQPLFRILIDQARAGRAEQMTRAELDFLYFSWSLMNRVKRKELVKVSIACLKPYIEFIHKRREALESVPGLSTLGSRLAIFTAAGLRHAEIRDVKVFGGIDLPIRGPVLIHKGDVKVVESIPEGCALVVDGGNCTINGLVIGTVAASASCEIAGNISGVVVARQGDIRAGSLVNQSTVISKEGRVVCRGAQAPKRVFGYREVRIAGGATGGAYLGRRVEVKGEMLGGEIQASEWAKALHFRRSDEGSMAIVLRRGLSCQDYGEVLSQDANRMLVNAMRFSQRMANLRHLLEITAREADEYAGNILLFILGEDDTSEQVQRVQTLRRRAAYLDRLGAGIRGLIHTIEDRLSLRPEAQAGSGDAQPVPAAGGERALLQELEKELTMLAAEGTIDRDLFNQREDVLALGKQLRRKGITKQGILDALRGLLSKVDDISRMRDELADRVSRKEEALRKAAGRAAILERAKDEGSRVEVLAQVLSAGRERRGYATFRKRANDRYVKIMQRNIEHRLSRVAGYRSHILDMEERIHKTRVKLWDEFMVSLPSEVLEGWTAEGARAVGRFDQGVRICAWRHLLDYARSSSSGVFTTPDSHGESVTYRRTDRGAIETA